MARKPSGKTKPKLAPVGGSASVGHNSGATAEQITDDQLQALTRQHAAKRARLVAAEKTARSDRMNFDKVIKSDLGANGLKDIKLLEQLSTPEGEAALKAELERQMRAARWAGLAIGTQANMFGPDIRSLRERAFEEGKRAGMESTGPLNPPANYSPGSEGYEGYIEGWHVGQAAINKIGKPASDEGHVLRPAENEEPGPDAFDDAADGGNGHVEAGPEDGDNGEEPAPPGAEPAAEGSPPADPWPDDAKLGNRQPAEVL